MIEKTGYTVVRGLLSKEATDILGLELRLLTERDFNIGFNIMQDNVNDAFSAYANPSTDAILLYLKNKIEEKIGKELSPTYSFFRHYYLGNIMGRHTDRDACEYSATLNLWNQKEPYPIYVRNLQGYDAEVYLEPGDALIYKGCEVYHWRDINRHGEMVQVFLHYVDKNGPFASEAEFEADGHNAPKLFREYI